MKKLYYIPFLALVLSSISHASNELITYKNAEIGWQVTYPVHLSKIDEKKYAAVEQKGKKAIEEATNSEVVEDHKNLLLLEIDKRNIFTSSISPYDSALEGPYEQLQKELFQSIIMAFEHRGVKFSHELGEFDIDGLRFTTMTVTIYGRDKSHILLIQEYYDRLFAGKKAFSMSITYNSRANRALLRNIVDSSKFSVRD